MKAIYKGNNFVIQWAITDAVTSLPFDFTGMFVDFILYSSSYHGRISGYTLTGDKMHAEIPADMLPTGVYNIVCRYSHNQGNKGQCICRKAFQITNNPEYSTGSDTVYLESYAAPLTLENMSINYIGHFPMEEVLHDQDRPAWALVGDIKAARPYFFYTSGAVPPGFQAGWNDLSDVLSTYDLTADKISIYDFSLVTEYNVSHNHNHSARVFSPDWGVTTKYYAEYPNHIEGKEYPALSKANMPGYTEHSFMSNKATSDAPFTVIDGSNEFTFEEAIDLVPEEYRFPGMRVTFINSMTRLAETWFYQGSSWYSSDSWVRIDYELGQDELTAEPLFIDKFELPKLVADMAIADENGERIADTYLKRNGVANFIRETINQLFVANPPQFMEGFITPDMLSEAVRDMLAEAGATITNLPDEEDLTKQHDVLKFKNKDYNPNTYSGLGRVYLRKNLVNGLNILTQKMVEKPNTIYIIQYDYDLQGAEITIPEGCTLDFQGGKITNGTINLQATQIIPNGCVVSDYIASYIQGTYRKGQFIFDTTLNKPIWCTGEKWVDATGAEV